MTHQRAGKPPCPNCGRPMGFEYVTVEKGKCQLWRVKNEHHSNADIDPGTSSDCFTHTWHRITALEARVADLEASKRAAQRSLGRHHDSTRKSDAMFPDNARIE